MTIPRNLGAFADNLNSSGQVSLTTGVSGSLPVANGGTGTTATPTAGGIVYGTGTTQAVTAAGTSGQVLTSAGSGTPTWSTPAAGAMTLLATVNATSGTYVTFDGYFSSAYDVYLITGSNLTPAIGADVLRSQVAIASTFQTGAFYKQTEIVIGSDSPTITGYSQATGNRVDMTVAGFTANNGSLSCYIYNPLNTDGSKIISFSVYGTDGSGVLRQNLGTFSYTNSSSALSGIRFYWAVRDWAGGKFQLYGLKNS